MIAAALFDGLAIGADRLRILAAPGKRETERVIRVGVVGLLLDRRTQGLDRAADVAGIQQRARELVIRAGKTSAAHLDGHAIAVDRLIEPALVIKTQTLVQILLCRVEGSTHESSP